MAHYKYTTEGMEVWRNRKDTRHRKRQDGRLNPTLSLIILKVNEFTLLLKGRNAEWVKIMIQLYAAYKSVTDRLKVKPRKKNGKRYTTHT